MKKWILPIFVITLFIGMSVLPASATPILDEPETEGPGWKYFVIGRIKSYEIFDYNGTEYINCTAIHVRIFAWNVFDNFPNLPAIMNFRFQRKFTLPYEGVEIYGPNVLGRYFIIARGVL